jgi:hypothetical protein
VADARTTIRILNNGETPVGITGFEVNNPMFVADLKPNQPGKEFELPPQTPLVQVTAMLMIQHVFTASSKCQLAPASNQ